MSIGNIDHKRWIDETKTWKLRSSKLRAVDNSIRAYSVQGGGTPGNLAAVKRAFEAWKASKEDWNESSRNQSGIIAELEGYLSASVPRSNAYLESQRDGRLGMLFVFGGLEVDTKLFNLVVESAWDAGSAVFGFDQTQSAIEGSMGGASDFLKDNVPGLPGMILDSSLVKKGRDMLIDKAGSSMEARKNRGQPPVPPPRPVPNAAPMGAIKRGSPALGGSFRITSGIVSTAEFEKPEPVPSILPAWVTSLINSIRQKLREFATTVWNALKKQFDRFQEEPFDFMREWGARIGTVINFIVSKVAAQAAPIVGGSIEIAKGLVDVVRACGIKYETYILGKNVNMSPGHPAAVVDAIDLIQTVGVGKGLYDTLKGAGQLALDVTTGAGGIVSLVVSCCEVLAKFIHRLWDTSRMKSFATKCQALYTANKDVIATGAVGTLPRAGEFGVFLRGYLLTTPTLACLALVSNFAGDAMQWLDMNSTFNRAQGASADSWKKGNAQFDAAAKSFAEGKTYLDNLKKTARKYLVDSGFDFKHRDPSVSFFFSAANLKKAGIGHLEAQGFATSVR